MSKAEEIFKQIKNKPEHEMADSFNERTNDMVLDAINTALNLHSVIVPVCPRCGCNKVGLVDGKGYCLNTVCQHDWADLTIPCVPDWVASDTPPKVDYFYLVYDSERCMVGKALYNGEWHINFDDFTVTHWAHCVVGQSVQFICPKCKSDWGVINAVCYALS